MFRMAQVESTFEEEESELKLQIVSVMEFLLEHKSSIQKRIDFLKENMAEKLQALHV